MTHHPPQKYPISTFPLITLILLSLSSCYRGQPINSTPLLIKVVQDAPEGPPGFRAGWKDTCHNAMVSTASGFYNHFYSSYQINEHLYNHDPDYAIAMKVATWFCGRYREIHMGMGDVSSPSLIY